VVSILGAGIWVGGGGLAFLNGPTPRTIYITPEPGQTSTAPATTESASVTPTLTASPTDLPASPMASPTPVATATPTTAAPTSTPPPLPPTATPTLPNLTFSAVALVVPYCGEMGTAPTRIANDSPVATSRSVEVRLTERFEGDVFYTSSMTVPALAAGEVTWVTFSVFVDAGCGSNHEFTFEIDPANALAESNELDNVRTVNHFIERNLPNLLVGGISLSTSNPRCLLAFDVTTTIVNEGPRSTAHDGLLRVVDRVGFTPVATRVASFPTIAAGASASASVRLTLGPSYCGETHQLVVTVDYDDSIEEFDEADNGYFQTYTLYH
jgi:hypothetical protein